MNIIINNINKNKVKSKNERNFVLEKVISPFKEIEKAIRKINNFEKYAYKMSQNSMKNRIKELIEISVELSKILL